jgi:hypothetical protein
MACTPIKLGDGTTMMVCVRGRRGWPCSVPGCHRSSSRICDYPLAPLEVGKEPKTCDARLCTVHAVKIGPNVDHCPPHAKVAKESRR